MRRMIQLERYGRKVGFAFFVVCLVWETAPALSQQHRFFDQKLPWVALSPLNTEIQAIFFSESSYELEPNALKTIEAQIEVFRSYQYETIRISGYFDKSEIDDEARGLELGMQRALAVRNVYLRFDFPPNVLKVGADLGRTIQLNGDLDSVRRANRSVIVSVGGRGYR